MLPRHIIKNCGLWKETEYYVSAEMKPADPDKWRASDPGIQDRSMKY
jgi:hypothetical protein